MSTDILSCNTREELHEIICRMNRKDRCGLLTPAEVKKILEIQGSSWLYQGEPCKERPHALLHSGKHSNGFVNVGEVIKNPENKMILGLFARNLANLLKKKGEENGIEVLNSDWVVGADTSSTALAACVAWYLGAGHVIMKKQEGGGQVYSEANKPISKMGNFVLQVEELVTTAKSAEEVRNGIEDQLSKEEGQSSIAEIIYNPFLPVVVDRSNPDKPIKKIGESEIISLLRLEIKNYSPEECPYCKAGSKAIKPKEGNNWKLLTK